MGGGTPLFACDERASPWPPSARHTRVAPATLPHGVEPPGVPVSWRCMHCTRPGAQMTPGRSTFDSMTASEGTTRRLQVRAKTTEHESWEQAAEAAGLRLPEWVRRTLNERVAGRDPRSITRQVGRRHDGELPEIEAARVDRAPAGSLPRGSLAASSAADRPRPLGASSGLGSVLLLGRRPPQRHGLHRVRRLLPREALATGPCALAAVRSGVPKGDEQVPGRKPRRSRGAE